MILLSCNRIIYEAVNNYVTWKSCRKMENVMAQFTQLAHTASLQNGCAFAYHREIHLLRSSRSVIFLSIFALC